MSDAQEGRGAERPHADGAGVISFGQEPVGCRVIDLSDTSAQVRIDGKRASRNFVGKRASLTLEGSKPRMFEGRVVWARPAVNGVYLGISAVTAETKSAENASQ